MRFPSRIKTGLRSGATLRPEPRKTPRALRIGRRPLLMVSLLLSLSAAAYAETAGGAGGPAVAEAGSGVSAAFYSDRVLTEDTVWSGEVTVEGAVAIAPQATLRIEPGTTVRFRRSGSSPGILMVQGRIVAAGTVEAPIVLAGGTPRSQAGDWQGVLLLGTEKKNLLENCRIEGAAGALEVLYSTVTLKKVQISRSRSGARFQDSFATLDGCSVSECETGVILRESEIEMYRGRISANGQGIVMTGGSLYLPDAELSGNKATALSAQNARLKLTGGSVADNGSGMLLSGCEGILSDTRLTGNQEVALSLGRSHLRITGNDIVKNPGTGLRVEDGDAVAWGNTIAENGSFDLYNAGTEEFRAPGNWWGGSAPKIFDNGGRGKALLVPLLAGRPQK